jgi:penicillin-binding protein-related factor A (putative recombinase)
MASFETQLNQLFAVMDLFFVKIPEERSHDGRYIKGEPFDYIVIMAGKTYCFDAKTAAKDVLYEKSIPLEQFNNLLLAEKQGATVFFLVLFKESRKIKFLHPRTILSDGRATVDSVEVLNEVSAIIKERMKSV